MPWADERFTAERGNGCPPAHSPMNRSASLVAALAASLFSLASVRAQTLSITEDILSAGGQAHLTYSNSALANQTITVQIDNGSRSNPLTSSIEIHLNGAGTGSVTWNVPSSGWTVAKFNSPSAPEVSRMVQ